MPEPLPAPQASLNFAENVSSEPLRRPKRRRFAIILGLLCALLGGGFAALREPPASKMFMEGCYSEVGPRAPWATIPTKPISEPGVLSI